MEWDTKSPFLFYLLCKYRFKCWSKKDIDNYQKARRDKISKFAFSSSQFFKKHYAGRDLADFASLPTVNKSLMMENLTDYNTLGLKKEELIGFALDVEEKRDFSVRFKGANIGMSSGTSGNKGIVITTREEENYLKAMYISRLVLPKGEKLNCAFILRMSSPAFNYNFAGNKLSYISQLQPIEAIIERLQELDPNVVSAPPSMLKVLAKEQAAGNLHIKPKILYSYAEILYGDVKKELEQVFGCRVHEIYQGSEGTYAMTCSHGRLHINEDMVFLELMDGDGNRVPDGEPCRRLLVTDLHKRSQPIIRYEINDVITIGKDKCGCGSNFRMIDSIQGRADDMLWGRRQDNGQRHFIYQDYLVRAIISASDDIDDFQVIQKDLDRIGLIIKLKKQDGANFLKEELEERIKGIFSKYNCIEPAVEVVFGDPIPNKASKKLARVICEIKNGY